MTTLYIDLQTGFKDDTVEVAVDGETVYEEMGVTTSRLEGIADDFAVDVAERSHKVTVRLPDRGITASTDVEVEEATYLGVSVEQGEFVFRVSDEAFGYL